MLALYVVINVNQTILKCRFSVNKLCRIKLASSKIKFFHQFYTSKGPMDDLSIPTTVFQEKNDRYKGVTIDTATISLSNSDFDHSLKDSLNHWKVNGIRGVWFKIPLLKSSYIPLLARLGFEFHHAKPDYLMMTKWLPEEPNLLPPYPHTHIGVAGLVINENNEILVIKEKFHVQKHWKFPGGYSNPGEDFGDTAKREVFEETGVETEFVSLIAFRHYHQHQFDCSDIYMVCHMRALSSAIRLGLEEIVDCRWMKLDTFKSHPEVSNMNRLFLEAFEETQRLKASLNIVCYFSEVTRQEQKVYLLKKDETAEIAEK